MIALDKVSVGPLSGNVYLGLAIEQVAQVIQRYVDSGAHKFVTRPR